jgi:two-component system, cell cycle response regulator DivK
MATPQTSSAAEAPEPAAGSRRVLVIEDNALNMKLFSAMIAAQGYDVLQAADGAGGLDLAQSQRPDLIIMDIQLPGMSGLDVAATLKASDATRAIPIIATSAFAQPGDEERILASGCDGFMAKPIAITPFLELIERLMLRPAADATCLA